MNVCTRLVIFVSCTLIFATTTVHGENQTLSDEHISITDTSPSPTLTVTAINPTRKNISQSIQANGSIAAKEIASITSQATGLSLIRLHAEVGSMIKTGQLLAEYDDALVKNDIAQAKASLQQAKIALDQARANLKRTKKLRASKAISAIAADNYVYQEKLAKAQLSSAQAVLNNQKFRASYAQVTAQVDGLIIEKQAVLGEVSNPGTKLFSVIVDNQLEWHAHVPSEQLPYIKPGHLVTVLVNQESTVSGSQTPHKVKGVVRKIDPTIDSQTRLGKVYVAMEASDHLKRGLFVRGTFLLGEKERFVIPLTALVRKDGFNYVFTADKDNYIKRVKVHVGQFHEDSVIVLDGLQANDRIVKTGVGFLNSGDLIKIAE